MSATDPRLQAVPADAFEPLARLEDLPDGALVCATTSSGEDVCLYNAGGVIGAVSNVCTHHAFPLCEGILEDGATLRCGWHGARFDLASGAVLDGPATDPLPVYDVRVERGMVLVRSRRAQ